MKKFYKISALMFVGLLGVCIAACGTKADNKGVDTEIALVHNEDILGMSGREILQEVGIKSDSDISSLTIKGNNTSDISWSKKIDNIDISDRDIIQEFYTFLSDIVLEKDTDVENISKESDAPKEREIAINTKSGKVYNLHYNPMTKTIRECFEKDGVMYDWLIFETLSDDFNDWLIKLCDIDITADYTDEYEKYNAIYAKQSRLHTNEDAEWFAGTEVITDADDLVLKVFICGDLDEGKEKVNELIKDTGDVLFEKANISFSELKKIKEEISGKIDNDSDKYHYVTFCGLTSKDISIGVSEETLQTDIDNLLNDFADYKEYISITKDLLPEPD